MEVILPSSILHADIHKNLCVISQSVGKVERPRTGPAAFLVEVQKWVNYLVFVGRQVVSSYWPNFMQTLRKISFYVNHCRTTEGLLTEPHWHVLQLYTLICEADDCLLDPCAQGSYWLQLNHWNPCEQLFTRQSVAYSQMLSLKGMPAKDT